LLKAILSDWQWKATDVEKIDIFWTISQYETIQYNDWICMASAGGKSLLNNGR
jgi:hypothetical protein